MKNLSTALLGAGMLALTACGGTADEAAVANNSIDTLTVPEDELLTPTDDTLGEIPAEGLGNESDVLGNVAVDTGVDTNVGAEIETNSQ